MDKKPGLKLGSVFDPVEIIDPDNVPVLFGEVVTELRVAEGCVYLSLGNVVMDGDEPTVAKVKISARIRLSARAVNAIMNLLTPQDTQPEQDSPKTLN